MPARDHGFVGWYRADAAYSRNIVAVCAHTFNVRNGANVIVTFGPTARWREAALHDADLFYSGAENMMTDFVQIFRQIDQTTIDPLYVRRSIIMVHRGNPLKINGFTDLLRPGVHIMIVEGSGQTGLWEDIAGAGRRRCDD